MQVIQIIINNSKKFMRIFLILLVFSIVVPKNIYAQSVGVDFDGDGRADVAGYEVQNDGSPNEIAVTWLSSSNNSSNIFEFGKRTETPVFSDYDGDGLTDAVVVGANEEGKLLWRYKLSSTPDESSSSLFGSEGDLIFFGCNFDGDSIADRAVLNDEGIFSYELSSDLSIKTLDLGKAGFERFLCADITGDGIDELVAQSSQSVKNKKNRKRRKKKKPAKSPSLANEKAIFHVWDLKLE